MQSVRIRSDSHKSGSCCQRWRFNGLHVQYRAFMLVEDVLSLQPVLELLFSSAGPHRIIKPALEMARRSQIVRSLSEKVILTN